ncbi:MAG TPA: hypothetical protein VLV55_08945 [Rhizomicrobium sp.]|nr:hypothetical protein [Rhizomicrobium sp.]
MRDYDTRHEWQWRQILLGVAIAGLLVGASLADDSAPAGSLRYSGTVQINQTRVAFIASAAGGGGTLHFRGHSYPFSIGGLGVGGIGVQRLQANGTVYNLVSAERFPGMYRQFRTGIALGNAQGRLWLRNADGVVLELSGTGKGVGLSLGADAVNISYK